MPLYGSGFLTSALYVGAEGPAALGVIAALHYRPSIRPKTKRSSKPSRTNGRVPSEYAVHGYDAGHALVLALKSGAADREGLAAALPKVNYTGPRGPLKIDPATHNIVQNIYVYDTVAAGDGLTQKIVGTIPNVADDVNGCKM